MKLRQLHRVYKTDGIKIADGLKNHNHYVRSSNTNREQREQYDMSEAPCWLSWKLATTFGNTAIEHPEDEDSSSMLQSWEAPMLQNVTSHDTEALNPAKPDLKSYLNFIPLKA
jgi:hypothetical protein